MEILARAWFSIASTGRSVEEFVNSLARSVRLRVSSGEPARTIPVINEKVIPWESAMVVRNSEGLQFQVASGKRTPMVLMASMVPNFFGEKVSPYELVVESENPRKLYLRRASQGEPCNQWKKSFQGSRRRSTESKGPPTSRYRREANAGGPYIYEKEVSPYVLVAEGGSPRKLIPWDSQHE